MHKFILFIAVLSLAACTNSNKSGLIQDCPEEKIVNKMPTIIDENAPKDKTPNEYFIYKGERKEVKDFDQEWLKKNCPNIKTQEVF